MPIRHCPFGIAGSAWDSAPAHSDASASLGRLEVVLRDPLSDTLAQLRAMLGGEAKVRAAPYAGIGVLLDQIVGRDGVQPSADVSRPAAALPCKAGFSLPYRSTHAENSAGGIGFAKR